MDQASTDSPKRSFLFLQGVASPFFPGLQAALKEAGYRTLKINFCGGDVYSGRFFKASRPAIDFIQPLENVPEYFEHVFEKHAITDIFLFGDTRPVNIPAIKLAKEKNIAIHVFEEGYFRPNWVTLDNGGVNAYSSIFKVSQNKPEWFIERVRQYDTKKVKTSFPTGGNLLIRGWYDIRYHMTKWFLRKRFPHYKTHRPDSPLAEYWGFVRRIPAVYFFYRHQSRQQINKLLKSAVPFYLLPLQLEADSQLRLHSPFDSLKQVIETTLTSFAKHAPQDSKLVIKLHPLDPWFVNYPKFIEEKANHIGIDNSRLVYLEAGDLNTLLKHGSGTILVNSTVGTAALELGCPVIALGSAIYDMPGLTFQGKQDDFWTQASAPDKTLFEAFRQCYIEETQINGSFYNIKGIDMAVKNSLKKLGIQ